MSFFFSLPLAGETFLTVDAASLADSFSFPFLKRSSAAGVLDLDFSLDTSLAFSLSFNDVLVTNLELVDGLVELEADVEALAISAEDALRLRSGLLLEDHATFELEALVDAEVEGLVPFPV